MKVIKGRRIPKSEKKDSLKLFLLLSLSIAVMCFILILFPLDKYNFYPPCPWYYFTKTYCPGCGTMRGISGIIHGDLFSLFRYNFLAAISFPFLLYSYLSIGIKGFMGFQLPYLMTTKVEIYCLLGIIIIYALLRNYFPILAP